MPAVNLRPALKNQYHLGLAMLRQCVEDCPDDLWESGSHPRTYWRLAFHAAYFTHLYLHPDTKSFVPWDKHRDKVPHLWGRPPVVPSYSRADVLEYIEKIDAGIDQMIDGLDLEAPKSGFTLYKMPKIELLMLNQRHLQGHIGQLSELLFTRGIEVRWAGMG